MDPQLQQELNTLITTLRGIEPMVRRVGQNDLREAAGLLVSAMRGKVPVGDRPHSRYTVRSKGHRAPKGSGNIVATYQPGNLQKSFRTLTFRRSSAIFVGPKFGGKRADGYYAHFVNFGTVHQAGQHFVEAVISSAGKQTLEFAAKLLARRIETYGKQSLGGSNSNFFTKYAKVKGRQ